MRKLFKPILIFLGITLLITVILGIVVTYKYEDRVKTYIVQHINENINTKVNVREVHFSVFQRFPYASLEFKDISALEVTNNEKKEELFSLASLFLQFNIIDILRENYTIKKVRAEHGTINLKIDQYGNDNYHFWKKKKESKGPIALKLESFILKDVNLYVLNEFKNVEMDIEAIGISLSGNFSNEKFTLKTDAHVKVHRISDRTGPIMNDKTIVTNTTLLINRITNIYQIKEGEIELEQLSFDLFGTIKNKETGLDFNMTSNGENLEIKELFSLFPQKQKEILSRYDTRGIISYEAVLMGEFSKKRTPSLDIKFNINEGSIFDRSSNISLNNLKLSGYFSNGKNSNRELPFLRLDTIQTNFGAGFITGNCMVFNLASPYITFNTNANVDLQQAKTLFKWDKLETASGKIILNLRYEGFLDSLNHIETNGIQYLNLEGDILLDKVHLKPTNHEINIMDATGFLNLKKNIINVDSLELYLNGDMVHINGRFKNLLTYPYTEKDPLIVDGDLNIPNLSLDHFSKKNKRSDSIPRFELPPNVRLNLKTSIGTLKFQKFQAKEIKGSIQLYHKTLTATDLTLKAMDGVIGGHVAIDDSQDDKVLLTGKLNTKGIDIYKLFYQCENFGQKHILSENIKGKATTSIDFLTVWDQHFNVDLDKIYVNANINIEDGELINYQPVMALSKYIEVEELERINFNTLSTKIEVTEKTVHIPNTEIKSSALDLSISGAHTFDNRIDYRFKLLLNDILWRKAKRKKKENTEFGYIADDGLGKTTLFLHMKGTTKDYTIKYDTKGLKESWKEDVQKEKTSLKKVLNKEFGWFKKDTSIQKNDPPKDHGLQFEWEEDHQESEDKEENEKNSKIKKKTKKEKKGWGKFIDKIAQPDATEYEEIKDF